jgi:hypothetical protein
MTVQDFLKKNSKYVILVLLVLFFAKTFQSCNRNMAISKLDKEIIYLNDSLNTMHGTEKATLVLQLQDCNDDKKELQYEVKLANAERDAANRRANAVQSTAEKIRENTTIKIENNSIQDTVPKHN